MTAYATLGRAAALLALVVCASAACGSVPAMTTPTAARPVSETPAPASIFTTVTPEPTEPSVDQLTLDSNRRIDLYADPKGGGSVYVVDQDIVVHARTRGIKRIDVHLSLSARDLAATVSAVPDSNGEASTHLHLPRIGEIYVVQAVGVIANQQGGQDCPSTNERDECIVVARSALRVKAEPPDSTTRPTATTPAVGMRHIWLAFQRADGLFYLDVDGGTSAPPRPLVVGLGSARVYSFDVSPTGRQVAFITPPPGELFVADVGGAPRQIAESVGSFQWSTDGTTLLYQSFERASDNPSGVKPVEISTIRADGSERRQVMGRDPSYVNPTLSPDARDVLVFRVTTSGCCGGVETGDTCDVPVTGGAPRLFAKDLRLKAWSPNGESALMATASDGEADLYLVDHQSHVQKPVGRGVVAERRDVWLPDSSAFVMRAGEIVWLVSPDGTRRKVVDGILPDASTPVVTPDGQRVVFFRLVSDQGDSLPHAELRIAGLDGSGERTLMSRGVVGPVQVFQSD